MKKAMTITPPGGQLKFVANMNSLEETIEWVAKCGFDAIELAICDPLRLDAKAIMKTVRDCGIEMCSVGTGQSYVVDKLSLSSPDPENRKRAVERYKNQVAFAAACEAPHTALALSMGVIEPDVSREQALGWVMEALEEIIPFTEKNGVVILLEPINRYETNLINTIAQAMELNARCGKRMKVLYDTFHMNIEAASMEGDLFLLGDQLGHVHTADSNRWAPGYGHINFQSIMHCLKQMNYTGYLSTEVLPLPSVAKSIEIAGSTLTALCAMYE